MTAPNDAIVFSSSTGNDITASGLGNANVYGSGASTTASSAVVTGIDTTGVSSGDLLWVQSSSGRQFSIIATVDSSTQVTCDDVFANTESGRTWAIGGKRATFDNADSRNVFSDGHEEWIVETETDQTLTSTIGISVIGTAASYFIVRGATGIERITQTANAYTFDVGLSNSGNYIEVSNLKFSNSSSSKTSAYCFAVNCAYGRFVNVHLDDQVNNHQSMLIRLNGGSYWVFKDCVVRHCLSNGVGMNRMDFTTFIGCEISSNAYRGISSNREIRLIKDCVFANNGTEGVYTNNSMCVNSIFYQNGTDGLFTYYITNVVGCVFIGNGGYGIQRNNSQLTLVFSDNAFYSNTSGEVSVDLEQENRITLTADPFVDPTASPPDWNLNAISGAGATLRASNFALNTNTSLYPFRQYVSDPFGSGGGNVIVIEE